MIHLVKICLEARALVRLGLMRRSQTHYVDTGYLIHSVLTELWGEAAPRPFVPKERGKSGIIEVWGYSSCDAAALVEQAQSFADPALLSMVAKTGGALEIFSKEVAPLRSGRRLGIEVRACPIVRLRKSCGDYRVGAEMDVYQARCITDDGCDMSREEVYAEWFQARWGGHEVRGASLDRLSIRGSKRAYFCRRKHDARRTSEKLQRPEVIFDADITVHDGAMFATSLEKGIGRHKAFGFGAILLTPPLGARHVSMAC